MIKSITKCPCGKELGAYDTRFVINVMTQEFVCPKCWLAEKTKKEDLQRNCVRCGKLLDGMNYVDHRYCLAPDKDGKYGFNMFCIQCEPYPKMGKRH